MELNQAGINLIKSFESCRLEAYPDPGTGGDPWTIGYGHTGPEVHKGLVWTQEQADNQFVEDSKNICSEMSFLVPPSINDNQFSACVSLAYNIGIGNFSKSSLLRCMQKNNWNDAAKQFLNWTRAAGKVLPGLVKRREAEMVLFQS